MQFINLSKYPIDNLNSKKGQALVAKCKTKMSTDGSLLLEGFIKRTAIEEMCAQVTGLATHRRLEISQPLARDPFFDKTVLEQELPENHPALFQVPQDVYAVASDLVPPTSMLRQVYDSNVVMNFIAAVNGQDRIYQYGDEFQALNVMYIKSGGNRAWHYDGSDYVVTLMLQPSVEGGEFEYAPFIRGNKVGDENLPAVQKLFSGDWPTKQTRCSAGALAVFNGRRSLHRVRTVYGNKNRIMSVLSYAKTKGEQGTPEKNVTLYGSRIANIYRRRGVVLNVVDGEPIVPSVVSKL